MWQQDLTIRSRTAGGANRSRGHANSKSRSRIIFFKSDSKFSKNQGSRSNLKIQSPISSIISKSLLLHKSISRSLHKNQVKFDLDEKAQNVLVEKFERVQRSPDHQEQGTAHQNPPNAPQLFIRLENQKAPQHKRQSNSQKLQRFQLKQLRELDTQLLRLEDESEVEAFRKLFPDKCKSAKITNKVFSFMDSAAVSPNGVKAPPVRAGHVRKGEPGITGFAGKAGQIIVKSNQIKLVRGAEEGEGHEEKRETKATQSREQRPQAN